MREVSPRSAGVEPDPTRALRSEPVRRDEVRIYRWFKGDGYPEPRITMPLGTYRSERRSGEYFVGDWGLWQPLMDELKAEYAVRDAHWARLGLGSGRPSPLPTLEISDESALEYVCEHCGIRFLDHRLPDNIRLCSNKCERERFLNQQRKWRKRHPPGG
jgi:hypothetical protein